MKILVVTQQVIPHEGGLSTHVVDLIAALRRAGHEAHLLHGGLSMPPRWRRALLAAAALGSADRYYAALLEAQVAGLARAVGAALHSFEPTLVHCHDVYAANAVLRARNHRPRPLVETVHGPALYEFRQMRGAGGLPRTEARILAYERAAYGAARAFIPVDSGQAAILREHYAVPADCLHVVFNSVHVDEVRALAAARPAVAPAEPFFLVPRRLVPKTGVRYAIEALARLPQRHAQLVIAGGGPLRAELEQLATACGVAERTHFLGSVPRAQLLPLFARATAVLIPSVPVTGVIEATSLAVMEAMACHSVPVASAIGGLAELIQDGETGLLVPPADADALARALESLLTDAPRRAALVAAATRKVEADYSTATWLARILRVYARALAAPAGARRVQVQ